MYIKRSVVSHQFKLTIHDFNFNWNKPYARTKRFFRDYRVPIAITIIFLVLILAALLFRMSQKASLVGLLDGVTNAGQEYGTLESKDKTDVLAKNNDNSDPVSPTPAGSRSSFALNANNTAATVASNPPATSNSPAPVQNNVAPPPAVAIFGASIAYFRQDSVKLECTSQKPRLSTCSKRYTFGAGIRTQNGPGSVNYIWRSNLPTAIESGSFTAGSGDIVTPLQKVIVMACSTPSTFNLQISVLTPSVTQSSVLSVNHNCNGI